MCSGYVAAGQGGQSFSPVTARASFLEGEWMRAVCGVDDSGGWRTYADD